MPVRVSSLRVGRAYSKEEFDQISCGLIPNGMDDKWFIFLENNILYLHRSWTGKCIYEVRFIKEANNHVPSEVLVNRDPDQYKETDDRYDEKVLEFLIENLLLGNNIPFPVPSTILKDGPKGAYQHHVAGTGYKEVEAGKE